MNKFPHLIFSIVIILVSCQGKKNISYPEMENESTYMQVKKNDTTNFKAKDTFFKSFRLNVFLTENEKNLIMSDKEKYWDKYLEIAIERNYKYLSLPNANYIKPHEATLIISDSIKYWDKYQEIATQRKLQDEQEKKRNDSLQKVIHPIDSVLPFGPKSLGHVIKNNKKNINFTILKDQELRDEKQTENRKLIHETWMYYLWFHPYADADLSENYVEKLLPAFRSYHYIKLNEEDRIEREFGSEKHGIGNLAIRISDIQGFEVYYTTTGVDTHDNKCSTYGKDEEKCCFFEDYKCNTLGHLVFYDRKNQHSTIIPVYELNSERNYIFSRFFYISKDNTIHIFTGFSEHNYRGWGVDTYLVSKSVNLSKSYEIMITKDKKFIVNKVCINTLQEEGQEEPYPAESKIRHVDSFKKYRDSILSATKPVISSYPFGSEALKKNPFPKGEFEIKLTDEDNQGMQPYQEALFDILKYYSKDFNPKNEYKLLPSIKKINQINVGKIERWDKIFNNEYLYLDCYIESSDERDYTFDFKLPNIGKYEVFFNSDPLNTHYEYFDDSQKIASNQCCLGKGGYFKMNIKGALILYNKETQTANVINAIDIANDSKQVYFRFFYINKNNQIEIYQGFGNHNLNTNSKYKLEKSHAVEVLKNGEIKVVEHN